MYFVVFKHWNVKLFGLFVYKVLPLFDGFRDPLFKNINIDTIGMRQVIGSVQDWHSLL